MGRVRRCISRRPLWGKNLAVLIGDFLQPLLQSEAGKLTCLDLSLQFQLAQGGHACLFQFHPFPFVEGCTCHSDEEPVPFPFSVPGGSVKMRPAVES
jgi:hypothetical protein